MPIWPRNLDLLRLSPKDTWTLDEACLGTLITGATGSGKTTGAFQYVVRSFLRAGFGGLFLCAKKISSWDCMSLVRAEGRESDVRFFDLPKQGQQVVPHNCFNFLTYEVQRWGQGNFIIKDVVNLLVKASQVLHPSRGATEDFFEDAKIQLLTHCLEVVIAAKGKVDFEALEHFIDSLPENRTEARYGVRRADEPLYSMQLLEEAREKSSGGLRSHEVQRAAQYFTETWPAVPDKTRGSVFITLSVFLHEFTTYPMRELFTRELTLSPDHILKGGIVIVTVNIADAPSSSKLSGVIWKHAVQRAIERREEIEKYPGDQVVKVPPIFIAVDEAQFWVTKDDYLWQTTARSYRGLSVYATQNISNFYGEMPGEHGAGKWHVESLFGNLQNRLFCQNLQQETNLWASESIGKVIVRRINTGTGETVSRGGVSKSKNEGWAEQLDYDVQPRVFTGLRRGGVRKKLKAEDTTQSDDANAPAETASSENGGAGKKPKERKRGQSEAIVVIAGRRFAFNNERWLRVLFDQFSEMPAWLALNVSQPWAAIISGVPQKTRRSTFRETVPLTPKGLWEAARLWEETRRIDSDDS